MFSILIALEPAFGALVGWLVLAQAPSELKIAAIVLVIAATVNQTLGGRKTRRQKA